MEKAKYPAEHIVCSVSTISKDFETPHPAPHIHEHYELYFLHSGNRDVFIDNQMYALEENCLAIIPPDCYHKTEGGAFCRSNLNVKKELLSREEIEILNQLVDLKAVKIGDKYLAVINSLLKGADDIYKSSYSPEKKKKFTLQIVRSILLFLSLQKNTAIPPASSGKKAQQDRKNTSSEILKIVQYINNNYAEKISLDDICKKFLISKTGLNLKFKDVMQTTVAEYILSVRLNRAIYLLNNTIKTIQEISNDCGFSSANYFSLIFKRKIGRPPTAYHRRRPKK